MSSEGQYVTSY